MFVKSLVHLCAALALAGALSTTPATADEYLTRKGQVPQIGGNNGSKAAPVISAPVVPQLHAMAPKALDASPPEALIQGLAAIKHGRDGSDTVIELAPRLQMMLKARGTVRPVVPGGGGQLTQVTSSRTYPYDVIGMVATGCTGALVMKHFVLTAPWCVYDTEKKQFYTNLDFTPALNGSDNPVGVVKWKNVWIAKGFQDTGDLTQAFALIELEGSPGDQLGWFGFGPMQGSGNVTSLTLTGYPFAGVPQNTVWEAQCNIDSNEKNAYFYHCPGDGKTLVTMLGAPFYAKGKTANDGAQLLGIHISSQDDKQNSWWALKLNDVNTQVILSWANPKEAPPPTTDTTDNGDNNQNQEDNGTDTGGGGDNNTNCTCDQKTGQN
jgi:V8-like Glu-specific endopeptidase